MVRRYSRLKEIDIRAMSSMSIPIRAAPRSGSFESKGRTSTKVSVGGEDTSVDDVDVHTSTGIVVVGVCVGSAGR